jgi:hypothetical protein
MNRKANLSHGVLLSSISVAGFRHNASVETIQIQRSPLVPRLRSA